MVLSLRFLPRLLLVIAVLLGYATVYPNAFLFDDEFLIVKNQFIQCAAEHVKEET